MATKPTLTANTRPILTQYEDGRCAHSRTPFGAMRAAYTQLLNNRHTHCTVWIPLALITPFKLTKAQKSNLAWARKHSTFIGDAEHVLLARVGIRGNGVWMRGLERIETLYYPEVCELARVAGLDLALVQAAAHAAAKAKAAEAGRGRAAPAAYGTPVVAQGV